VPALSVLGLAPLYGSIVLGEVIASIGLMSMGPERGIPDTLLRVAILVLTAFPIAYMTGYVLLGGFRRTAWA
jgi:hypothetical protein